MPDHVRADLEAEYMMLLREYAERVLTQTAIPSIVFGENSAYRAATRKLRVELDRVAGQLQDLSPSSVTGQ